MPSTSTGLETQGAVGSTAGGRQAETPLHIVFIHGLSSGLFKIHLRGTTGR